MRVRGSDNSIGANPADWIRDSLDQCHDLLLVMSAGYVPEGHLKIARRFNAGMEAEASRVPKGRPKHVSHFSRPFGTLDLFAAYPALKRRAILECPSGTRFVAGGNNVRCAPERVSGGRSLNQAP